MVHRSSRGPRSSGPSHGDGSGLRPHNVFRNDGSFLEMFKRMQEKSATKGTHQTAVSSPCENETKTPSSPGTSNKSPTEPIQEATDSPKNSTTQPSKASFVGKRRGGRVLPTGKVKRAKPEGETPKEIPTDAWSAYLAEVKRYKETTCEEDGKTRPLVK